MIAYSVGELAYLTAYVNGIQAGMFDRRQYDGVTVVPEGVASPTSTGYTTPLSLASFYYTRVSLSAYLPQPLAPSSSLSSWPFRMLFPTLYGIHSSYRLYGSAPRCMTSAVPSSTIPVAYSVLVPSTHLFKPARSIPCLPACTHRRVI